MAVRLLGPSLVESFFGKLSFTAPSLQATVLSANVYYKLGRPTNYKHL